MLTNIRKASVFQKNKINICCIRIITYCTYSIKIYGNDDFEICYYAMPTECILFFENFYLWGFKLNNFSSFRNVPFRHFQMEN
jgi:hypothetical protein